MPDGITNEDLSAQIDRWRKELNGRVGTLERRADANDLRWSTEALTAALTGALGVLIADESNDAVIKTLRDRLRQERRDDWRRNVSRTRAAVLWTSPLLSFVLLVAAVIVLMLGVWR